VDDVVREMQVALAPLASDTLRQVDEALRRLDQGGYGLCALCGQAIAEARLRFVPLTGLCRDCQPNDEDPRPAEAPAQVGRRLTVIETDPAMRAPHEDWKAPRPSHSPALRL
jgi:RNA polymerase-binding transcription factor DksA